MGIPAAIFEFYIFESFLVFFSSLYPIPPFPKTRMLDCEQNKLRGECKKGQRSLVDRPKQISAHLIISNPEKIIASNKS